MLNVLCLKRILSKKLERLGFNCMLIIQRGFISETSLTINHQKSHRLLMILIRLHAIQSHNLDIHNILH